MEFVIGPVLALLISLKYTQQQNTKQQKLVTSCLVAKRKEYDALIARVELIEKRNEAVDKEMLQKIMTTVMPIAKAVNKLNQEVGL
jgi:Trp operon repressor